MIKKIYRTLEEYLLIVIMIISTMVVCYSVFMRYVMNSPTAWCEEIVCYCQVWMTFIGICFISRDINDYIRFDFIVHRLSKCHRYIANAICRGVLLLFCIMMSIVCSQWIIKTYNYGGVSTPMQIPNYMPRFILPVSFVILSIRLVEGIIKEVKNIFICKELFENFNKKFFI